MQEPKQLDFAGAATFPGGPNATFTDAEFFWSNLENLKKYDIVLFSCEGAQLGIEAETTPG